MIPGLVVILLAGALTVGLVWRNQRRWARLRRLINPPIANAALPVLTELRPRESPGYVPPTVPAPRLCGACGDPMWFGDPHRCRKGPDYRPQRTVA